MSEAKHTPGPWELCHHLRSIEEDAGCGCGYRGVIYGPDKNVAMAICQPGHDQAPPGQEGSEPNRYPREVEIANARLISAAPDLLETCKRVHDWLSSFSMPPTSTIQEKQEHMAILEAAIAKAEGR